MYSIARPFRKQGPQTGIQNAMRLRATMPAVYPDVKKLENETGRDTANNTVPRIQSIVGKA
jgi:hypothetical protein